MSLLPSPPGRADVTLETPEAGDLMRDPSMHRFGHRAMATLFEILCVHPDGAYARAAANHAFDLLDKLEGELSRFIDNSDIERINHLPLGGAIKVSRSTLDCLLLARIGLEETGGAFDISLGTGLRSLEVQPWDYTVRTRASGIRLDLGGIGKGYAVDRMAEVLADWGIERALIHGGQSSVRALDPPPGFSGWPLRISIPGQVDEGAVGYSASARVLSASGTQKGNHVFDPRSSKPVARRPAAWVAAQTDALLPFFREMGSVGSSGEPIAESPSAVVEMFSTAFLILSRQEIDACRARRPGLETWLAEPDGRGAYEHCLVHLDVQSNLNSGGTA